MSSLGFPQGTNAISVALLSEGLHYPHSESRGFRAGMPGRVSWQVRQARMEKLTRKFELEKFRAQLEVLSTPQSESMQLAGVIRTL